MIALFLYIRKEIEKICFHAEDSSGLSLTTQLRIKWEPQIPLSQAKRNILTEMQDKINTRSASMEIWVGEKESYVVPKLSNYVTVRFLHVEVQLLGSFCMQLYYSIPFFMYQGICKLFHYEME